jgi:hypothetical protein
MAEYVASTAPFQAHTEADATRALAAFVAEVRRDRLPEHRRDREITVDEAIDQCLTEHLLNEKGREPRTVDDYRRLHRKWFARVSRVASTERVQRG